MLKVCVSQAGVNQSQFMYKATVAFLLESGKEVGKTWEGSVTQLCCAQTKPLLTDPHGQTWDRHLLIHFGHGVYSSHHRIWYIMN